MKYYWITYNLTKKFWKYYSVKNYASVKGFCFIFFIRILSYKDSSTIIRWYGMQIMVNIE
jgi:hypothetical protein